MVMVILAVYVAFLFALEHLGVIRWSTFWKASPFVVWLLAQVAIILPMGWSAPQGPALVGRHSVQITPNVAGEVIEVAATPNVPMKPGDVLFRIDPVPYEAALKTLQANLAFAEERLGQAKKLQESGSGRLLDVDERQAQVDQLRAQVENASWNLDKTVVRAPANGFVTNVTLRKGARVGNAPVMAFIETSEATVHLEIAQINTRYVAPGQPVEVAMKLAPGQIMTGKVREVLPAISSGQGTATGFAITPVAIQALPFVVTVDLDDAALASRMPAGAAGDGVIYTDQNKLTHIVRRLIIRQLSILNYVNPY